MVAFGLCITALVSACETTKTPEPTAYYEWFPIEVTETDLNLPAFIGADINRVQRRGRTATLRIERYYIGGENGFGQENGFVWTERTVDWVFSLDHAGAIRDRATFESWVRLTYGKKILEAQPSVRIGHNGKPSGGYAMPVTLNFRGRCVVFKSGHLLTRTAHRISRFGFDTVVTGRFCGPMADLDLVLKMLSRVNLSSS